MERSKTVTRFVQKYGRLPTERDPDYLELLRMSKYRILSVPDFKPGKCANCGSAKSDGRNYVDFGLEVDWYGTVFLCGECLRDIAINTGMFKAYEVKILQLEEQLAARTQQSVEVEDLESAPLKTWEEVKTYFDSKFDGHYLHVDGPTRFVDGAGRVQPSVESSEPVATEPEQEPSEPKPRVTKPATVSGSADVPKLAKLLTIPKN